MRLIKALRRAKAPLGPRFPAPTIYMDAGSPHPGEPTIQLTQIRSDQHSTMSNDVSLIGGPRPLFPRNQVAFNE